MDLVFPLLLCLMVFPHKTMNQPEEKPNGLVPDQTEAADMQDVGQPDLTLLSTVESHGAQAGSGEDPDNDQGIDLEAAKKKEEASQGLIEEDAEQAEGQEFRLGNTSKSSPTEETGNKNSEEPEQVIRDILKLGEERTLLMFTANPTAYTTDNGYEIEQNEDIDPLGRDILESIESLGLTAMNSSEIKDKFGNITESPSVFFKDQFTIYQMTPTSEMEVFNEVAAVHNRPILIQVFCGVRCFVFLDPARQRICLIFTVSRSEFTPAFFEWFLQEYLNAVVSEVITYCLNGITESCPTTVRLDILSLCSVMALLLMMCQILRVQIRDFLHPPLDEIEMHHKITRNSRSQQGASERISILELVREIRDKGFRFIEKVSAGRQSEVPPDSASKKIVTIGEGEIHLSAGGGVSGGKSPENQSSSGTEGQRRMEESQGIAASQPGQASGNKSKKQKKKERKKNSQVTQSASSGPQKPFEHKLKLSKREGPDPEPIPPSQPAASSGPQKPLEHKLKLSEREYPDPEPIPPSQPAASSGPQKPLKHKLKLSEREGPDPEPIPPSQPAASSGPQKPLAGRLNLPQSEGSDTQPIPPSQPAACIGPQKLLEGKLKLPQSEGPDPEPIPPSPPDTQKKKHSLTIKPREEENVLVRSPTHR